MKNIVIGMSGGVDSSVAALLLKRQGYNVIGLFMKNWEEDGENGVCAANSDYEDVKRVCGTLDIPYYTVNFSKEYKESVFSVFLEEYKKGRTPNPDVLCNKEIKFKPFIDFANTLNADYIATGHYAKVAHTGSGHYLYKAKDLNKDQSYFLNQLSQNQLERVLFPLENLLKSEVREIARKNNIPVAEKKDSTGICFIGERNFRQFLKNYLPAQPGKIKTLDGKILGEHIGLMYYTIGQRRGLNVGGQKNDAGRWFVISKDLKENVLYVAHGDESGLYYNGLVINETNFIPTPPKIKEFDCYVKTRYREADKKAHITVEGAKTTVSFYQRERAVTEGQYAVLYGEDGQCLGGGVIELSNK